MYCKFHNVVRLSFVKLEKEREGARGDMKGVFRLVSELERRTTPGNSARHVCKEKCRKVHKQNNLTKYKVNNKRKKLLVDVVYKSNKCTNPCTMNNINTMNNITQTGLGAQGTINTNHQCRSRILVTLGKFWLVGKLYDGHSNTLLTSPPTRRKRSKFDKVKTIP